MLVSRLSAYRRRCGWSQQELAERCGVSRTEISAIETGRVIPSTSTALALARAFDCSVEELFALRESRVESAAWAWMPKEKASRFWQARLRGKTLLFPHEWTLAGAVPPDGVMRGNDVEMIRSTDPHKTLVIAGCDPSVALLIAQLRLAGDVRIIPLSRSSRKAMDLLKEGLVHAAGLHFSAGSRRDENRTTARALLGQRFRLIRVAGWDEGIALEPSLQIGSVRAALTSRLRWVGREEGSGARQCLDQILGRRSKPRGYHRHAADHFGVAATIRSGWAQAGVCIRLPAEDCGLRFLQVRREDYDICFSADDEDDPRIQALLAAIRSSSYRQDLQSLPGYHTEGTGELQW